MFAGAHRANAFAARFAVDAAKPAQVVHAPAGDARDKSADRRLLQ